MMTAAAVVVGAAAVVAALGLPPAHAAANEPGTLALQFGSLGHDDGEFEFVRDLAIGPDNRIVVLDNGNGVQVFHPNGTFDFGLLSSTYGNVDVGPDGSIAVSGYGLFHPNGTIVLGSNDLGREQWRAHVDIGPDGRIVTADVYSDHHARVFHPNGTFAFNVGELGLGPGELYQVSAVAFGPNGSIFVADRHHGIQMFHPNGTFASVFELLDYNVNFIVDFIDVGPSGEFIISTSYSGDYVLYAPNGTKDDRFVFPSRSTTVQSVDIGPTGMIVYGTGYRISVINGFKMVDALPSPPPNGTGPPAPPVVVEPPPPNGTGPPAPPVVVEPPPDLIEPPPPNGTGPPAPPVVVEPPPAVVVDPPPPPTAVGRDGGYPTGGMLDIEFGSLGSGPGEFMVPHAIAEGPGGIIAVADILNNRVQVFYPNGTYAFQLELSGPSGYISYIAFGSDDRLFISDIKNHRVQVFRLQYP